MCVPSGVECPEGFHEAAGSEHAHPNSLAPADSQLPEECQFGEVLCVGPPPTHVRLCAATAEDCTGQGLTQVEHCTGDMKFCLGAFGAPGANGPTRDYECRPAHLPCP